MPEVPIINKYQLLALMSAQILSGTLSGGDISDLIGSKSLAVPESVKAAYEILEEINRHESRNKITPDWISA